jgi:cAMP-dependent protein kinase regulator
MSLCSVNSGDTVIKEGGIGNFFYILKEGTVNLYIEGKLIKQILKGESFGELALLHGAPRSATIVASADCLFWVLERKNFKKIVDHINTLHFEENKQFVQSISILSNIENDQKTILCSNLIKEIYEEGTLIVKEGDQANCLYIVKDGEVNCVFRGKIIVTLKKGDYFGEKAILIDSTRTMDVVAKTKCVCYSISIETLKQMCGEKYRDVLYMNFIKSAFTQSKYLKKFQPKLVESIYECFSVVNYGKREVVVPTGHVLGSKIIVVIEGNLINVK